MSIIDIRHVSNKFYIDGKVALSRETGDMRFTSIDAITIEPANCCECCEGIMSLKRAFREGFDRVVIDDYDDFSVIRIGKPKTLWFTSEAEIKTVVAELEEAPCNVLAYFDSDSVAFVTDDGYMRYLIKRFLRKARKIKYYENPVRKMRIASHSLRIET